jgi:hypothetical protein
MCSVNRLAMEFVKKNFANTCLGVSKEGGFEYLEKESLRWTQRESFKRHAGLYSCRVVVSRLFQCRETSLTSEAVANASFTGAIAAGSHRTARLPKELRLWRQSNDIP